jgi:hypothetical protein
MTELPRLIIAASFTGPLGIAAIAANSRTDTGG